MELNATVLSFYINGRKVVENDADPDTMLSSYLRDTQRLRGTKVGCGQGGCGACTVMLSEYDSMKKCIRHWSVMACLVPITTLHGKAVTTVEGVGNVRTRLHPIQERLAKGHGVQCGFCSPGMVMSMYTLLRNNPEPNMDDVQKTLQGNVCRCTGYRSILQAAETFTKDTCCGRKACCRSKEDALENREVDVSGLGLENFTPYDPSQEVIFPSELMLSDRVKGTQKFTGDRVTMYIPASLDDLFQILADHPTARVFGGNTANCNREAEVLVSLMNIPELSEVELLTSGILIGSSLTLTQLEDKLNGVEKSQPAYKTRIIAGVRRLLGKIAALQIRNMGTIGGNIGGGNSVFDLAGWLLAGSCKLVLYSKGGRREAELKDALSNEARGLTLKPGEIIGAVIIPFSTENQYYRAFKQSRRGEFDWAEISAGMMVEFMPNTIQVKNLILAYGNVSPLTAVAEATCRTGIGGYWNEELLSTVLKSLSNDLKGRSGGHLTPYKETLAIGLFYKFYKDVQSALATGEHMDESSHNDFTPPGIPQGLFTATQVYEEVPVGQSMDDAVGRPLVHHSAYECVTGQAQYTDDIPKYRDELYLAVVRSNNAHANILNVDPSAALRIPGVVSYIDHHDVPGSKMVGPIVQDDEIFVTKKIIETTGCSGARPITNITEHEIPLAWLHKIRLLTTVVTLLHGANSNDA